MDAFNQFSLFMIFLIKITLSFFFNLELSKIIKNFFEKPKLIKADTLTFLKKTILQYIKRYI